MHFLGINKRPIWVAKSVVRVGQLSEIVALEISSAYYFKIIFHTELRWNCFDLSVTELHF